MSLGGSGSVSANVGIGGNGGSGNTADSVNVDVESANLTSFGAFSPGILAQSIGGEVASVDRR